MTTAAPTGNWPRPLNAWYLAFVVFLAYLIGQIDRQIIVMLAGEMKATLLFSDEQLGFLMGLGFAATYAIGAIVFAQLAEYRGRRNVLLLGITLWSAATVACALVKSFEGLLIARLVVGLGEGALAPAAMPMISAVFPAERRSFPLAFCLSGGSIGLLVAPIATGGILHVMEGKVFGPFPVVGIVYGWQTAFLIAGSIGVVVGMLLLTLKEPKSPTGEVRQSTSMGEAYRHFFQNARFYSAIFVAAPLGVAPGFALIAWIPSYLGRTYAMSPEAIGSQFGSSFIPSMILGPVLGGLLGQFAARLPSRRGYFDVLLALIVVSSLVMASPMLMTSSRMVLIVFALCGVFQFVIMSIGMIGSQQLVAEKYRGHATSILMASQMVLGAGLGPFAVGILATRIVGEDSLHLAMIVLVAVSLVVPSILLLLARTDRARIGALMTTA